MEKFTAFQGDQFLRVVKTASTCTGERFEEKKFSLNSFNIFGLSAKNIELCRKIFGKIVKTAFYLSKRKRTIQRKKIFFGNKKIYRNKFGQ